MKNVKSDLKNLSVIEIDSLLDELNNLKNEKNKTIEFVEKIKQEAEINNIDIKDIINILGNEEKTKKTTNKIKYKIEIDGKLLTWTGRGVKPKWFINYLEEGGDPKDIEVKENN